MHCGSGLVTFLGSSAVPLVSCRGGAASAAAILRGWKQLGNLGCGRSRSHVSDFKAPRNTSISAWTWSRSVHNGVKLPSSHQSTRLPQDEARRVILEEARTLQVLASQVGEPFDKAVALIESMPAGGRVILTGVGKSGHVARKIAASLASTGTAAFFVHATEAMHGDLGSARPGDVCIAMSYSGATAETLAASRGFQRLGAATVAITSDAGSALGKESDVCLELGKIPELDHNKLAPTASTVAAMALGDALTVVISKRRGFSRQDFEKYHPGGELGRQNRMEMAAIASGQLQQVRARVCAQETKEKEMVEETLG